MQMAKLRFFFPLLLLILLPAARGFATPILTLGNNPQSDEQNIFFTADQQGTTITGITSDTNTVVQFSSTTDTLLATANGQADVTALDELINDITITLPSGGTYLDLILNPFKGSSTLQINVATNITPSTTFNYNFGNGQNFFTITTPNSSETISSVHLIAPSGFESLKQPRISGVSGGETVVPEPTSLLLLGSGISIIGLAAWRKRKRE